MTLEGEDFAEPEYLTVGVIGALSFALALATLQFFPGQPNVGKSSLLNALFGATKVRASKTPGKVLPLARVSETVF